MLVVRKDPLDYRLCLSCISLACMGSWAKREQIRATDLNKCLFFFCSAGALSEFNLLTDCNTVSNTCTPPDWASTVQSSQQWQWGTSKALALSGYILSEKYLCLISDFYGLPGDSSKSWKWPGTPLVEEHLVFSMVTFQCFSWKAVAWV